MASLRHIRRRIRSIQNTKQIMRAMQLVSGSKFKRAQSRLLHSRQVLEFLDGLLQRVVAASPELDHPTTSLRQPTDGGRLPTVGRRTFAARRSTKRWWDHPLIARHDQTQSALLIITSDTGLAGSYNANLIQRADAELRRERARQTQVSYVGKRGHRHFTKRGYAARDAVLDLAGRPDLTRIDALGATLMDRFLSGEIGSVRLLYAAFISPGVSRPTVKQWLPMTLGPQPTPRSPQQTEYLFEPSAQAVFEDLLPRWAMATFRLALLEAFTSEHGARMIAMKNATDNAQELLDSLTMQRNKIRQATITKELSEIVGTVEALK